MRMRKVAAAVCVVAALGNILAASTKPAALVFAALWLVLAAVIARSPRAT